MTRVANEWSDKKAGEGDRGIKLILKSGTIGAAILDILKILNILNILAIFKLILKSGTIGAGYIGSPASLSGRYLLAGADMMGGWKKTFYNCFDFWLVYFANVITDIWWGWAQFLVYCGIHRTPTKEYWLEGNRPSDRNGPIARCTEMTNNYLH